MRRALLALGAMLALLASGSSALFVVEWANSSSAECDPVTLADLAPPAPVTTTVPAGVADDHNRTAPPTTVSETPAATVDPEPAPPVVPDSDPESEVATTEAGPTTTLVTTSTTEAASGEASDDAATVTTTTSVAADTTTTVSTVAETTTTSTTQAVDHTAGIGVTTTTTQPPPVPDSTTPRVDESDRRGGDTDCDPFTFPMAFPVAGPAEVVSVFGDPRPPHRIHAGVDLAAEKLTPVVAVADGTVIRVAEEDECCLVGLAHPGGWTSWYIHLNNDSWESDDGLGSGVRPDIELGTELKAGEVLGWLGDSGNAETTVPHLHFELHLPDGRAFDPLASVQRAQRLYEGGFHGAFSDDDGSDYEQAVNLLASVGALDGCDDTGLEICPEQPASTTWVELILRRLEGGDGGGAPNSTRMAEAADPGEATDASAAVTAEELLSLIGADTSSGAESAVSERIAAIQGGADTCGLSGLTGVADTLSRGEAASILAMQLGLIPCVTSLSSPSTADLRVVFSAFDRDTGAQGIYLANPYGGDPVRLTPDDGLQYSWPAWAFGGNKIVFTARRGAPGTPENIYMMDPDGSNRQQLSLTTWRNAQPKVSPDGEELLFTSMWEEFPEVALYSMDLATTMVTNLSAVATTHGGFDSDPKWSSDGSKIVFANSADPERGTVPTQIYLMGRDGSAREALTEDDFFNTDPELSPDGRRVAIASYRGEGHPGREDPDNPFATKLSDWMLVVKSLDTGAEIVLNQGDECFRRPIHEKCGYLEGPAWIPNWTPDGSSIGFLSVLSNRTVCICVARVGGGEAQPIVESNDLAITWFDWEQLPSAPSPAVDRIGADAPESRLIFGGKVEEVPFLAAGQPDRWSTNKVTFEEGVTPESARWSPDRTKILFNARVEYNSAAFAPWPSPPPGENRHVHFTLDMLNRIFLPPVERPSVAEQQVFMLDVASGEIEQLTNPWIEDYMDALPDGDARGNIDPDFSADGRSILFTNVSSTSHESFLLKMDLESGEVYNLSNATAGAIPVADNGARFSPEGSLITFSSTIGETSDIYLIDASDGRRFTQLTDDDHFDVSPSWSPDGRFIVYSSYRGNEPLGLKQDPAVEAAEGTIPLDDWVLVKVDVHTREQTALTDRDQPPAFRPVWSPDGSTIAFISISSPGQPDIYMIDAEGGTPRPVQVTLLTHEVFFDWR